METIGNVPRTWKVNLKSGNSAKLFATSYSKTEDQYIFDLLVNATEEEQSSDRLRITGRFPTMPERVIVTVAAFPADDVVGVESGNWKE